MASDRQGRARVVPTSEDPTDLMGTLWEMAYAIREEAAAMHQMMDRLGRQHEADQGGNSNGLEVDLEYLKFAKFQKVNPPSFKGAFDPNIAAEWVKAMEKVFSVLAYTDHQKSSICYLYVGSGCRILVECLKRLLEDSQTDVSWEVLFYQKYFPTSVRNARELEFVQLC